MTVEAEARGKQSVRIGPQLERMLDVSRGAALPVLLVGRHGIGKSEFLEGYATARGVKPYVLDLSLLEATDLTGIPFLDAGTTRFAPPATLPSASDGGPSMLILEELNRCDRSVRQPCLQLLTARRLNEYQLPDDCFLAACINPPDVGYEVDELDRALASRFVTLRVEPCKEAWTAWAHANGVRAEVVSFIGKYAQAFDAAPPRTWTYVARLLGAALDQGWERGSVEPLLHAVLPPIAARALAEELLDPVPALPAAEDVALDPSSYVELVRLLNEHKRLDAIRELFDGLALLFAVDAGRALLDDESVREGITALAQAAPADLRRPLEKALKARRKGAGP